MVFKTWLSSSVRLKVVHQSQPDGFGRGAFLTKIRESVYGITEKTLSLHIYEC